MVKLQKPFKKKKKNQGGQKKRRDGWFILCFDWKEQQQHAHFFSYTEK